MNYILSTDNGRMISRHNTEQEGRAALEKWARDWKMSGVPNVPPAKLYYNGTKAIEIASTSPLPV